jgi:hypothetical protein
LPPSAVVRRHGEDGEDGRDAGVRTLHLASERRGAFPRLIVCSVCLPHCLSKHKRLSWQQTHARGIGRTAVPLVDEPAGSSLAEEVGVGGVFASIHNMRPTLYDCARTMAPGTARAPCGALRRQRQCLLTATLHSIQSIACAVAACMRFRVKAEGIHPEP